MEDYKKNKMQKNAVNQEFIRVMAFEEKLTEG